MLKIIVIKYIRRIWLQNLDFMHFPGLNKLIVLFTVTHVPNSLRPGYIFKYIYIYRERVECHYNAVIDHKSKSNFALKNDTPYLTLMCELWGVCSEGFGENWPHNGTVLFVFIYIYTYIHQGPESLQVQCCHLLGIKPLPERTLTYQPGTINWIPRNQL